jgi:hypothetical protein
LFELNGRYDGSSNLQKAIDTTSFLPLLLHGESQKKNFGNLFQIYGIMQKLEHHMVHWAIKS